MLRRGDSGPRVERLQKALAKAGFSPGAIDGEYGPGTEAAVLAFQRSEGLLADGVAGPRTQAVLAGEENDPPVTLPDAIAGCSVPIAADMFFDAPLGNIKKYLPVVLASLKKANIADRPMVLMALATIRAESAGFVPIDEGISRYNTSPGGHPFDLYDNRGDLGNRGAPDGARFKGRGFIQLTGRSNYQRYGKRLEPSLSLIAEPERANDPPIAADLLALFLKDKEMAIKSALLQGDLRGARRLVNGGSHGLDPFCACYEKGNSLLPP